MSRTTRKKAHNMFPKASKPVGTDGPVWRSADDPETIARREAHLDELEAKGCEKTRVRREKVVPIPARWQGQVTGKFTKARRKSKARNKVKDRRRKKHSEGRAHHDTQDT